MSLPIQISPSPIVTATIELRIKTDLSTHEIFSIIFPQVQKKLPKVLPNPIPKQIAVLPPQISDQFKYIGDYILSNDQYSLSISENVVSLSNINEYTLWGNYSIFVYETLRLLFSLNYIITIERIGLRYASLFNNVLDISEILNSTPLIHINGYDEKFNHFRADYKIKNYNLHLQIFDNARVQKNNALLSGAVIDIDASYTSNLTPNDKVFEIINELHTEEKILFFEKLIKAGFIKTLNPKY